MVSEPVVVYLSLWKAVKLPKGQYNSGGILISRNSCYGIRNSVEFLYRRNTEFHTLRKTVIRIPFRTEFRGIRNSAGINEYGIPSLRNSVKFTESVTYHYGGIPENNSVKFQRNSVTRNSAGHSSMKSN